MNTLVLRPLDGFDKHVSCGVLLSRSRDNWDRILHRSTPTGFTGPHGAAYLGIMEVTLGLLEMKEWDLDAGDVGGNTAILRAARKGHRALVQMLLGREGVTPNTADKTSRTSLSWAAGHGHEIVVKMLWE